MKTSPDFITLPDFYKKYVIHVQDLGVLDALQSSGILTNNLVLSIPEAKGEYRYDTGKWSVKEVICHMMDAERIFSYRALRFSRNDETPLAPFEENDYGPRANAHARTIKQLAEEMKRLRATTLDLFTSFTPEMLQLKGNANNKFVSVLNLGYIIAGHETHHRNVLTERYLNK